METFKFDEKNIRWSQLAGFEYFVYAILDIDQKNNTIDILYKFEPHKQIVLHRHKSLNHTFVVQGEHHLYEANGQLKEIRPVGSYTTTAASSNPHREYGGDEGAIVLFSMRGSQSVLYEVLDDDLNIIATLSCDDFIHLYK